MDKAAATKLTAEVIADADAMLTKHGFERQKPFRAQGVLFHEWFCSLDWITHVFKISYQLGYPERVHPTVSARLDFPEGDHLGIDGTTVYYLIDQRDSLYGLKGIKGVLDRASPERLRKRILSEFEESLQWFAQYAEVKSTLSRLRSAERNGAGVGTEPHARAVAFLERLRDQKQ